jgi:chorismate synthase
MVAAGAVAKKWLALKYGTRFVGWMTQIGDIAIPFEDESHIPNNPFFAANASVIAGLEAYMDALRKAGDSCGARIDGHRAAHAVGWASRCTTSSMPTSPTR